MNSSQVSHYQLENTLSLLGYHDHHQFIYKQCRPFLPFCCPSPSYQRRRWKAFINTLLKEKIGVYVSPLLRQCRTLDESRIHEQMLNNTSLVAGLVNALLLVQRPDQITENTELFLQNRFLDILKQKQLIPLHSHFQESFKQSRMDSLLSFQGGIFKFHQDLKKLFSYPDQQSQSQSINRSRTGSIQSRLHGQMHLRNSYEHRLSIFIFTTLLSIIQVHLNYKASSLYSIRFRVYKCFTNESKRISSLPHRQKPIALKQLCIDLCQFVEQFCQMVIYLYGLDEISMKYPKHDLLFNQENLYNWSLCVVLPPKLFTRLLDLQLQVDHDQVLLSQYAYQRLRLATPEFFEVPRELVLRPPSRVYPRKSSYDPQDQPYYSAISTLAQLSESINPIQQLQLLISMEENIYTSIDAYKDQYAVQTPSWISADQLMPILLYVTAQANQTKLHSQMTLLSRLLQQNMLNSHAGFLLMNLLQVLSYLQLLARNSLGEVISSGVLASHPTKSDSPSQPIHDSPPNRIDVSMQNL